MSQDIPPHKNAPYGANTTSVEIENRLQVWREEIETISGISGGFMTATDMNSFLAKKIILTQIENENLKKSLTKLTDMLIAGGVL